MTRTWIRDLSVTLTSTLTRQSITFGQDYLQGKTDLNIDVSGTKYLSTLKDSCVIQISNVDYSTILKLIMGEYYEVEVSAGYKNSNKQTMFKGYVIYISNSKDTKTTTCYILCGSKIIAKYGQSKLNLSLSSGINMYAALEYVIKRAGITNYSIDTSFKNRVIQNCLQVNGNVGSWIDKFIGTNNMVDNTDSSSTSDISIFNPTKVSKVIKVRKENFVLVNGFPKLTSEGMSLSVLPTYNFVPGDVIQIDNSILDMSVSSYDSSSLNVNYQLDKNGQYMIYQVDYHFNNRDGDYYLELTCKAKSLYTNITGG